MNGIRAEPVSTVLFVLALFAFLIGALDGAFRPFVVGSLAAGALPAIGLWAHYRRSSHPSISRHADRGKPEKPEG